MAQAFTFKFTERQLSILQDALDNAVETELATPFFGTDDFAEVASDVAERLAY